MSARFTFTVTREIEGSDPFEQTLDCVATATGYDNTDVGCGGPNELDEWTVDDWGGEPFELTAAEESRIDDAAQDALYD